MGKSSENLEIFNSFLNFRFIFECVYDLSHLECRQPRALADAVS